MRTIVQVSVNAVTGDRTESTVVIDDAPIPARQIHAAYIKLALHRLNKLAAVNTAVAAAGAEKTLLWENASELREDDPDVTAIAGAVGVSLGAVFDRAEAIRRELRGA